MEAMDFPGAAAVLPNFSLFRSLLVGLLVLDPYPLIVESFRMVF